MSLDLDSYFTRILEEIRSGKFAKQFQEERQAGYPMHGQANEMITSEDTISKAEDRLKKQISSRHEQVDVSVTAD